MRPVNDDPSTALREHLEGLVREWLGIPRADSTPLPELPARLARRLLRLEEYEQLHRDRWGCWEFAFCESYRDGTLLVPEIDEWAAARRAAVTPTVPLWPNARSFAVCLTHDVDLVSSASTVAQALRSIRLGLAPGGPPRPRLLRAAAPGVRAARALHGGIARRPRTEDLERSLAIEQERGVTASYFFTVFPDADSSRFDCTYKASDRCLFRGRSSRIRSVMRELAAEGFDVGLHGSYSSAIRPGRLASEREQLAEATGLDIRTTRQHFLHWDVRATPVLQDSAGLTADSTIGFNRAVGFRAATSLPFRLFDLSANRALDLLEVPLVLHDGPLLRSDGLELDLELARTTMKHVVDRVAGAGGVATLLFHPNNLARREFAELYRWAIDYVLDKGAWVTSLRGLETWWRERAASLA